MLYFRQTKMSTSVLHNGTIISLSKGIAAVRLIQLSACSTCHAKGACTAADMKEKVIEAQCTRGDFEVGETVQIIGTKSHMGLAVFLAYIAPILLLISTLFIFSNLIHATEGEAAIYALLSVTTYYILLSFFRKSLKRKFIFHIEKYQP